MDGTLPSPGNYPREGNHEKKPMKPSGSDTASAFWTHAEGLEIQIVLAWKLRLRDRHESVRAGAVAMLDETALREARYSAISYTMVGNW